MASYAGQIETGAGVNSPIGSTLYGICNTAATTAEKVVVLPEFDTLLVGSTIHVKFVNGNTAADPTLTVGSTAAKPIYIYGTVAPGSTTASTWAANSMLSLTYDGTAWRMNDVGFATWNMIYPVGSIYMSVNSTSPASLFGGTWEQLQGRFLIGANSTYPAGTTGGAATVTLTEANLPSHRHSIPALSGTAASNGSHLHTSEKDGQAVWTNTTENSSGVDSGHGFYHGSGGWWDGLKKGAFTMRSAGAHTHSVSTSASNTGYTGSGTGHNNMPPYLSVYMWKRTA